MKFTVIKSKVDISNNLSKMNDNTDGNIISRNTQLNEKIIKITKVLINFVQNTKGKKVSFSAIILFTNLYFIL